jgi:hypothetical protein
MTIPQDTADLRQAFDTLQAAPVAFEYGPLRAYRDGEIIQRLWREHIDPHISAMSATQRRTAQGVYEVDAPSVWHAYFYLRAHHQYVYRSGRPLFSVPDPADPGFGPEHMFFRGQQSSAWSFVSSLQRFPDRRPQEQRAATALARYFYLMFAKDDDLSTLVGRCFAQHYGIRTDLTDVTGDLDVAVWFASRPLAFDPKDDGRAVVRAFTWAGQEGHTPTSFLLAPPFVRNLYQQRGLFIDTTSTDGVVTSGLTLDVRFPRSDDAAQFRVVRGRAALDIWPPNDEHEQALVDWARAVAAACDSDDHVRARVDQDRDNGTLPDFWLHHELWDREKQFGAWLEMLDWVLPATCVTSSPVVLEGTIRGRFAINPLKVAALARSNRPYFIAMIDATRGADFSTHPVLGQVLAVAEQALAD